MSYIKKKYYKKSSEKKIPRKFFLIKKLIIHKFLYLLPRALLNIIIAMESIDNLTNELFDYSNEKCKYSKSTTISFRHSNSKTLIDF